MRIAAALALVTEEDALVDRIDHPRMLLGADRNLGCDDMRARRRPFSESGVGKVPRSRSSMFTR